VCVLVRQAAGAGGTKDAPRATNKRRLRSVVKTASSSQSGAGRSPRICHKFPLHMPNPRGIEQGLQEPFQPLLGFWLWAHPQSLASFLACATIAVYGCCIHAFELSMSLPKASPGEGMCTPLLCAALALASCRDGYLYKMLGLTLLRWMYVRGDGMLN